MKIKARLIISILLIFLLLLSIGIYIPTAIHKSDKVFFFYERQTDKIIGEKRRIPKIIFNKEHNIDVFVNELLLGPADMKLDPLFPIGTKVKKILYRDKSLYVDLNFMALFPDKKAVHGFDKGIELVEKNIKFNFSYVKDIVITVLGQEPEKKQ